METKLFALKIPKHEKEAMDYTARETGRTLTKLYYKSIQTLIFETLGIILLNKIDRRMLGSLKNLKDIRFEDEDAKKHSTPIIEDFVELMIEPNNRRVFNEIFDNIEFVIKEFLLYKLDLKVIARSLGRLYLEKIGNFDRINIDLARALFFEYMLSQYYKLTAIGSLKNLNTEWYNKRIQIKNFEAKLIKMYLEKYRDEKVEAIEIEEILEVSEYRE